MRSNAYITVMCDNCGEYEEVPLTPIARGGYDGRGVDDWLTRRGWRVDAGEDICESCVEEENEGE